MAASAREAIKASFWRLLDERPLNRITVKDITQDCEVNRNSFYYHFTDIPALLNELVLEDTERAIREHADINSIESCLNAVLQFALENRRRILHIYRSTGRESMEWGLMRICRELVEKYMDARFGALPISSENREVVVQYYQCECFGQVVYWLENGMSEDIRCNFSRIYQLRMGMTEELIRRCCADSAPAEEAE